MECEGSDRHKTAFATRGSHVASQMKIMALSFLTRFDFNAFHIKLVSYILRFDSEIIKRSINFSVDTCC